jgi:hypothetical protein
MILSFGEFVRYFFSGDAATAALADVSDDDVTDITATPVAEYYRLLFLEPDSLADDYSRSQIDAGFGAMINCNVPANVPDLVWDRRVQFELRESMIRAMKTLYERLFDKDPLFGTPFMWWDPIAYPFEAGIRSRSDGGETSRLQDVMFDTLREILNLPSHHSQKAALHGLGHLHHPDTAQVIEMYLDSHNSIPPELRAYARLSAMGLLQ